MELSTQTVSGLTIVTVTQPRIDASVAIRFKDAMRAITQTQAQNVILDMSAVSFVDSSGLGAIVAALKQLGAGRKLHLAGLSGDVEKVFRLTRMDRIFEIHASVEDAIAPRAAG